MNTGYNILIRIMLVVKEHDNTDRDIIIINKDSLILKLFQSKEFYNSTSSAFGFVGVTLALLSAGYLTETFHNVGFIPGETVRTIFIALGLISAIFTIKSLWTWHKLKDTHEPKQIVSSLLKTSSSESSIVSRSNEATEIKKLRNSKITTPPQKLS